MEWINVNEEYLDYLRKIEKRVPRTDYGENKYKPFFGNIFEKDDLCYITQISHAQERHRKLRQQKDFYKIYDPKDPSRLIAVVNLNYMFPIPKSEVFPFYKKKIESYRKFSSSEEKSKYINLLDKELFVINSMNLSQKAKDIYDLKYRFPDSNISKRCFDFKMLEVLAKDYVMMKVNMDSEDKTPEV